MAARSARSDLTGTQLVDHGVLTALVEGARADAEHSLWAANASAQGYVSRQGLILQAVPAMTIGSPEAAERYLSRLSKIGATFDALGQRYLTEAADGRTPTAVGVDQRAAASTTGPTSTSWPRSSPPFHSPCVRTHFGRTHVRRGRGLDLTGRAGRGGRGRYRRAW